MEKPLVKGRYALTNFLGKRTYGKVYKAYDMTTKQYVAMKYIDSSSVCYLSAYSEFEKLKAVLDHGSSPKKYIVQILDHFKEGTFYVIVLELLYCDLHKAKIKFALGYCLETIAMIAYKVCKALCHLQKVNLKGFGKTALIHGDLKLDNIMFTNDGFDSVKIVDFGLAQFQFESKCEFSQNKNFRPPEGFFYSLAKPTPAADMWSLGMILFYLFSTKHLFRPVNSNEEQIANLVYAFGEPSLKMMKNDPNLYVLFDRIGDQLKLKPIFASKGNQLKTFAEMFYHASMAPMYKDNAQMTPWLDRFNDLLLRMLEFDPKLILKPREALKHPFFSLIKKDNRFRLLFQTVKCGN